MKLNISYPTNATEAVREMSAKEEQKLYGKKIGDQFDGAVIAEDFAGCIFQITGGNDHQGVPMVPKQDTIKRIRLLLSKGDVGYHCKRNGVRKRKTVRGSIVSSDIQVVALILVKVPEGKVIEGLTDVVKNKSHYPKRLSKLQAMFGIPDGVDPNAYIADLVRQNDPNAKVPRIKVTGFMKPEEMKRRQEVKALREARREQYKKEKAEYESKYGSIKL